jgi:replicative DNA helicase
MFNAERIVLGMCLNDHADVARVMALGLDEDHFREPVHRVVWKNLGDLASLGGAYPALIDELRVCAPLTQSVEFYAAPLIWRDFQAEFLAEVAGLIKQVPLQGDIERIFVKLLDKAAQLRMWGGYGW